MVLLSLLGPESNQDAPPTSHLPQAGSVWHHVLFKSQVTPAMCSYVSINVPPALCHSLLSHLLVWNHAISESNVVDAERRGVSIAERQNSPAAHSRVLLQRLWFQCSGMRAVTCTEMPDLPLRAQALSRAGGQTFVLGEHQETGSKLNANLHRVSARAPSNCLSCFRELFVIWVTGRCWNHYQRICNCGSDSAPSLEVCWNLLSVFVGTESDPTSIHIWCCFIGSWKCLETTAWCMKDFCRSKTFTSLSHFFCRKLNL